MATRRHFVRLAVLGLLPALPRPGAAQDRLAQAAEFVRQSGNELATLAGTARSDLKSSADGRARLQAFLDRVVDVDAVARFCLGRFWRLATPAQQQDYVRAFHTVLLNNVALRLGDYQGGTARVVINRPVQTADDIEVATSVERQGNPPVHVTWTVSMASGSPKIVDVIAEGMSMRLTQRSDYAAFLVHNNNDLDALIRALQKQAAS